ncbi:MAG TPA: PHP domain-containing protein [Candidatus Dormibacteraeota bacterium]|nr:PHP domain-containing protein [Candidatus Dormibacteraeota bacterium]
MTEAYAELHAHTNFSFLDGAAHPEELAAVAAARGLQAMAITDHGGLYAMVRFTAAARHVGLRTIIGAELTVEAMPGIETPEPQLLVDQLATTKPRERQRGRHHLTVLARDGTGFSNLTRMLSHSNLGAPPSDRKGYTAIAWELLTEHTYGLVVLSGCKRMGLVPRLLRAGSRESAAEAAARLRDIFGAGDFFLELQNHMVPEDPWTCAELAELGRATGIPCVATNDVHMMTPQDKPLQDVLVAIRERGTLDEMEAQGYLAPNAERYVKTRAEMEEALLGPAAGGPPTVATEPWLRRAYMEALDRTVEIANRCDFELDLRSKRFPGFPVPDGETPFSYLYQLCQQGVKSRYKPMTSTVARRLQTELEVIEKTGLAEFFLINWDLMRFAKDSGIPGQGRGSAADSIVAYLLGITRVDPVEHNLLFERFLHEEQKTTPDIDIDFASSRREEVIQYIYEKYGADRSGMVANVVTFRPRMAIRQVGKALGFSPATIDRLAKSADSWYPEEAMAAAAAAGLGEVRAAPVDGGPELSRDRAG